MKVSKDQRVWITVPVRILVPNNSALSVTLARDIVRRIIDDAQGHLGDIIELQNGPYNVTPITPLLEEGS